MSPTKSPMEELRSLLTESEIFSPGQGEFSSLSAPWSLSNDLHPKLVVQPSTLEKLQKVIRVLYNSDLDFAIRGTGTGSVSARDVILSMQAFKSFSYDAENKEVLVGGGLTWGEVDELMEQRAPGYQVVGARCPWVGVTGSTLSGGLSWLSHEFGLISDPGNFLDAQIVLRDGRTVWAGEEDEKLLWALRGGGGNFGAVAALKFRAHPYPSKIFSGLLFVPYTSLHATSVATSAMARAAPDPKVAMHVITQGPPLRLPDQGPKPGICIVMYDAHGEAHARDEAFKWAFALPGAQEVGGGEMTLRQIHQMVETMDFGKGENYWLLAVLIEDVDEEMIVRMWDWYGETVSLYEGFGKGTTLIFEFFQENAFSSSGSRAATAWPHSSRRHAVQIGIGCKRGDTPPNLHDLVMRQIGKAQQQFTGGKGAREYYPSYLYEWNDVREVFGENFEKLKVVKLKYDPRNRFDKSVNLMGGKEAECGQDLGKVEG